MPVKITSKFNGYRLGGRLHPSEATTHPDGTFTDAEISAMKADSILTVETISANPSKARRPDLLGMKRPELNAIATSLGIENPANLGTNAEVVKAVLAVEFPE
ncbi:MAG: hypothetical protein HY243_12325 [Proteobacteria bacterium]|nr:hypothetical protein [Pseudomonadota bacterium]